MISIPVCMMWRVGRSLVCHLQNRSYVVQGRFGACCRLTNNCVPILPGNASSAVGFSYRHRFWQYPLFWFLLPFPNCSIWSFCRKVTFRLPLSVPVPMLPVLQNHPDTYRNYILRVHLLGLHSCIRLQAGSCHVRFYCAMVIGLSVPKGVPNGFLLPTILPLSLCRLCADSYIHRVRNVLWLRLQGP